MLRLFRLHCAAAITPAVVVSSRRFAGLFPVQPQYFWTRALGTFGPHNVAPPGSPMRLPPTKGTHRHAAAECPRVFALHGLATGKPMCATVNVAACHRARDDTVAALLAYLNQARFHVGIETTAAPRFKLANLINRKIAKPPTDLGSKLWCWQFWHSYSISVHEALHSGACTVLISKNEALRKHNNHRVEG